MSEQVEVTLVTHDGEPVVLHGEPTQSLMAAATAANHPGIVAECGGSMSCGTCHVVVDAAWAGTVGAAEGEEAEMLELLDASTPTSRLSCQVVLHDGLHGLVVRAPAEQPGI